MTAIINSLLQGDRILLLEALENTREHAAWRDACSLMLESGQSVTNREKTQSLFIEFGHRVREKIADDRLMAVLLRRLLSPFTSEGCQLFRGENADRYKDGRIGFCWTPKREVAEIFARGLNAMEGEGGLLLSTVAPTKALIAGPSAHSKWLGEEEYWVDPAALEEVDVLEKYPNCSIQVT